MNADKNWTSQNVQR